jgi:predicted O-methyltransferase YrrM
MLGPWHSFLYAAARAAVPAIVVETGVLFGHSSAAILAALEHNRAGRLVSVDLPPEQHRSVIVGRQHVQVGLTSNQLSIGCAIPSTLRSKWSLQLGDSLELLPKIFDELGPVSMFIHDSLHTYDHMMAEFHLGYSALEPGGLLISDDIDYNSAWFDFCHSKRENWKALSKESISAERFGFLIKSARGCARG